MERSVKKLDQAHGRHATANEDLAARLVEMERELANLQSQLDRTQRLATLGTVAAMVAHEVNNLMTPVLTYAQLAQQHPNDLDLVAKALARASAGALQASKIASSILALSKPETEDDSRECDVAAVVSEAIACVPRGTLRATRIEAQVPPGLRASIGPASFQQVVLNLLLNSVKAVSGKGGTISVRAKLERPGALLFEVEDDGPGISAELASRVFEPFASGTSGNGLGLAICRRLVHDCGGEIWIENPGTSGAKFRLRLPLARNNSTSAAA